MPTHDPAEHESTTRLEAFSDGVFAIAITLLVLEISVPELHEGEDLGRALRGLWPSYFGFAVSFITIGIVWINHHAMFRDIERQDHALVVFNLFLLMSVSFLPFPTAVLAEFVRDNDQRVRATLVYGITFIIIAVAFQVIWLYASIGRRLIDSHVSDARVRTRTIRYLTGFVAYCAALPLAFINPWITLGIYAFLALFFLLPLPD